jgi:hypothetical protein
MGMGFLRAGWMVRFRRLAKLGSPTNQPGHRLVTSNFHIVLLTDTKGVRPGKV